MGIALPVAEILSNQIPMKIYQGFYIFLYLGSIFFVCFVYASHTRSRAVFSIIKSYRKWHSEVIIWRHTPVAGGVVVSEYMSNQW